MKVAGRKNDGAWYRANVMIKALDSGEKEALQTQIEGLVEMDTYLTAVQEFYQAAGLEGVTFYPNDPETLASGYVQNGIPRQTWMGILSYDTYTRSGTTGDYTYEPNHRQAAAQFGKAIRRLVKQFTFARRQAYDLTNKQTAGNPGGIANATAGD